MRIAIVSVVYAAAALVGACSGGGGGEDGGPGSDVPAGADSGDVADVASGTGDGSTGEDTGTPDAGNTFPPEEQTAFHEKGLIIPQNSLPCTKVSTGETITECNHHGSTIAELPDGTIGVVWFHGEYEKSLDSRNVWSRLAPGAKEWTAPEVVYDDPGRSEGNAAIWVGPDGTLYVYFVTIFGDPPVWDESKIRMTKSTDGGRTWAEPVFLREEYCWMARMRPLRLDAGRLILPLYNECLAIPVFMYADAEDGPWVEQEWGDYLADYLAEHVTQIQPALIQRSNGDVVAYTRDGSERRRVGIMVSRNNGRNWTKSIATGLPNSGTSIDAVRLLDGHVMVVYNNSPTDRFPLAVALSTDEGETFAYNRHINAECESPGACSYAYPSIAQSTIDGAIWVSYTHNRETIGWVHFNEKWIMESTDPINIGE
ncbi:MAG: exo-alpha-sialidase [Deltaproteobacteria bacterium]|nr:exo-alpha-sialidase [Deltaproteobacteria bacterium]